MCRYDMLHAMSMRGSRLSNWTKVQDRQLHRLMCYVNTTLDWAQYGWICDSANNVEIGLFVDADFAGDLASDKSTSGVPSSSFR